MGLFGNIPKTHEQTARIQLTTEKMLAKSTAHYVLWLWEHEPSYNKELNGLPTSLKYEMFDGCSIIIIYHV